MKIAMISWEYPPQFTGGLGIHCLNLVEELVRRDVEVDFYLPAGKHIRFQVPLGMGLKRVEIDRPLQAYVEGDNVIWDSVKQFQAELDRTFEPGGIEVIHAHDWMGMVAAQGISERYGIPLIWTVHSTEFDRAADTTPHPGILAIEREGVHAASLTIAVSARTKERLVTDYDADPARVAVIYNGIRAASFQSLAEGRDYESSDGYVLFLGRVTRQKGPDDFLQAAKLVLAKKEARFMIAGDGEMLALLRRRARRWNIGKHVKFMGTVKGEQLLACYKNAQIFVLPAVSEPFGITVLEAMAAGVPAIISSTTGAGEIVRRVLRVEPRNPEQLADAILKLLGDAELRKSLALDAAKEAEQFTWGAAAAQTRELYEKLSFSGKGSSL
ncbi:glycosyltransferase family 4 protein [Paenibacillus thermotolerans]|uniref:glycosyltransferase family 4 protein n=1 Tax=Paenibacillus thermotolerans TaxID=3027807 RepID=UPI002368F106|nr:MULTISPECIES: glycosyltransferase family 4 protein [unclassified Paenibacillus]